MTYAVPDDVVIDTFNTKLRERVAVRGRIVKKPEPKLFERVRWDRVGVLAMNITGWICLIQFARFLMAVW